MVVSAPVKGEGGLAIVFIDQIAFAERAAGKILKGVHGAHVRLDHSHDLFIRGPADLLQCQLGSTNTDSRQGTSGRENQSFS